MAEFPPPDGRAQAPLRGSGGFAPMPMATGSNGANPHGFAINQTPRQPGPLTRIMTEFANNNQMTFNAFLDKLNREIEAQNGNMNMGAYYPQNQLDIPMANMTGDALNSPEGIADMPTEDTDDDMDIEDEFDFAQDFANDNGNDAGYNQPGQGMPILANSNSLQPNLANSNALQPNLAAGNAFHALNAFQNVPHPLANHFAPAQQAPSQFAPQIRLSNDELRALMPPPFPDNLPKTLPALLITDDVNCQMARAQLVATSAGQLQDPMSFLPAIMNGNIPDNIVHGYWAVLKGQQLIRNGIHLALSAYREPHRFSELIKQALAVFQLGLDMTNQGRYMINRPHTAIPPEPDFDESDEWYIEVIRHQMNGGARPGPVSAAQEARRLAYFENNKPATDRDVQDQCVLRGRAWGFKYQDIRKMAGISTPVPTLRGRLRNRVRTPEELQRDITWDKKNTGLLQIACLVHCGGITVWPPSANVEWSTLQNFISVNGGSHYSKIVIKKRFIQMYPHSVPANERVDQGTPDA
ncbi:hypothetical protein G7Z17_g10575 [Cylindrodendrum hubeiense]|uniref:Uncharacterized protein n=1 Tax=Cylindrodendrum hubeiense TaxID=595255 RepID=A0A9P5H2G1_9HYPO|nr:hypothetical protein G7Z17_g10575 [Cylindrodendrum hubeiense]